jgi:hypothetical protein
MKFSKLSLLTPVVALALTVAPFVHAQPAPTFQVGMVEGVVSGSNSNPVDAANVSVTCNSVTLNGTTNSSGFYFIQFDNGVCTTGMNVTVNASKGSENGSQTGTMLDNGTAGFVKLDVAIVNVPMVPEFGLITGALALLGSAGSFLFAKGKKLI